MLRKKREQLEQTDLRLQSQLGEEERFRDLMRRTTLADILATYDRRNADGIADYCI